MIKLGDGVIVIDGDLGPFDQTLRRASRVAGTVVAGVGTAITGALALATKEAVEFESAFAGIRKTVDATEEEFAAMREEIVQLSTEVPITASELAKIGEIAGQLGIEKENIVGFTKTIADLANTTDIAGESGALMVAQFANITGTPEERIRSIANALVDLGNNSATTENAILQMGQRIAGAGTLAGLSEGEILGLSASLASVGIRAELGGTALSRFVNDMNSAAKSGGDALKNYARIAGESADVFQKRFLEDPAGAIELFVRGLARIEQEGGDVAAEIASLGFKGQRMIDVLGRMTLASDGMAESLARGRTAFEDLKTTALDEEAQKRYETTAAQLQIMKNTIKSLAIVIGDALLPPLNKALELIGPLVIQMRDWAKAHPELTEKLVILAAIVGGLMLALAPLLFALPGLIFLFGGVSSVLSSGVIAGIVGFTASVAPAVLAVGVLVFALGGLVVAVGKVAAAWGEAAASGRQVDAAIEKRIQAIEAMGIVVNREALAEMSRQEQIVALNRMATGARENAVHREISAISGLAATREQVHRAELARIAGELGKREAAVVALSGLTEKEIRELSNLNAERRAAFVEFLESLDVTEGEVDSKTNEIREELSRLSLDHRESPSINDNVRSSLDNYLGMLNGLGEQTNLFLSQLRDAWFSTWNSFSDLASSILFSISDLASRVINQVLSAVAAATGLGFAQGGVVPGFASGGLVPGSSFSAPSFNRSRGHRLIEVGERGKELMIASTGSRIIPNHEARELVKESAAGIRGDLNVNVSIANQVVNEDGADSRKVAGKLFELIQKKAASRGQPLLEGGF